MRLKRMNGRKLAPFRLEGARRGMWRLGFLFLCVVVAVNGNTDPSDVEALNVLYSSLKSPSQLTNWLSGGGDPCGSQSWKGVTCSGSAVTELHLSGLGLSGGLGYGLDKMTSLTILELSNNNIGSGIPYQLPPNLQRLDLSGNALTGDLPYSISKMKSLQYLSVSRNQLSTINDMFWELTSLTTLDLSSNKFSGNLPKSFSALSSLDTLYLQDNQFTGTINVLGDLPLTTLNVANNQFTGWIPERLKNIENLESGGNSWNSGPAPPSPSTAGSQSESDSGGKKSGLSGGAIAGIVLSILIVCSLVAIFLIRKKSSSASKNEKLEQDQDFAPLASNRNNGMISIPMFQDVNKMTVEVQNPAPVNLNPPIQANLKPPPFDRSMASADDDSAHQPVTKKTDRAPISVTVYSVADLQMATGSFTVDNLLGEGSIGRVYIARFDDGKILAVKKIKSLDFSSQATEEFLDVVSDISRIHHPYVAELMGYCSEHGQHLLVYEFYKNGSLHDFLHLSDEYSKPLTWNTRVKIALGTARALEYLHETCSPSVVHKNLKSVNILLDAELTPHLSDCGLSKLTSNVDYQAMHEHQSSGYSAPEVTMSGQYTFKSDVFSFGVIMLELLTGRKPFDSSRSRLEQSLVCWATPQLHDIDALDKMVDPALKGLYPAKSLSRFADVIALCIQSEPEFRPPMSEVVQALVRLVQRANMSKKMGSLDEQEAARRSDVDIQDMF